MPPYRDHDDDSSLDIDDSDVSESEDPFSDDEESYSDADENGIGHLRDIFRLVHDYVPSNDLTDDEREDFDEHAWADEEEESPTKAIFDAVLAKDIEQVTKLAKGAIASVNAVDKSGATPLCYAAVNGSDDMVKCLLELGAEPLVVNEHGATPLSLAAGRGHVSVVSVLLDKILPLADTAPSVRQAFCEAASKDQAAVVDLFLAAKVPPDGASTGDETDTPLMRAAKRGNLEIVKKLLSKGADVEKLGKTGETALHLASEHNRLEVVQELLAHGALVNKRAHLENKEALKRNSVNGGTALTRAAYRGHADVVDLLLKHGADPTAVDEDGDTPLIAAVAEKHLGQTFEEVLRIVEALLGAGCDVNQMGHQNNTALIVAAATGWDGIVGVLLSNHNARVDIMNDDGDSALMFALERCGPQCCEELLAHNAPVNHKNATDDTALHKAVEVNSPMAVDLLLNAGADANAANIHGDTPLILACQMDQNGSSLAVIERLITAGANVDAQNKNADTALKFAIANNAALVMCELLRAGAAMDWASDDGVAVFDRVCRKCPTEAAEVMQKRLDELPPVVLESLLERALNYDLPGIVPMLVERGRTLQDEEGNTLLMLAVLANDVVSVKHLLDQGGFEHSATNKRGVTALEMSTSLGHFGCFLALVGAGAKLRGGFNEKLMLAALNQRWGDVESLMRAQNDAEAGRPEGGDAKTPDTGVKRRFEQGTQTGANGLAAGESAPKRSRMSYDTTESRARGPDAAAPSGISAGGATPTPAPTVPAVAEVASVERDRLAGLATTPLRPTHPDAAVSSLSWLADLCEMDPSELFAPSRSVANRILKLVRKRLSFNERLEMFRTRLDDLIMDDSLDGSMDSQIEEVLPVEVSRGSVLLDAYRALKRVTPSQLRLPLSITFNGEEGQDDGGLSREFFNELAKEVTKPELALFKEVPEGSGAFQPNPDAHVQEDVADVVSLFRFIGCMVGKAISIFHVFNVKFTHSFLKQMLKGSLSLEDLQSVDPVYYNGLVHVLNQEVAQSGLNEETFTTEENFFGENRVIELVEGGASIPVTDENKMEYIALLARHRMTTSIKQYIDAFCEGLWDVVPVDLLQAFTPTELGEVISGFPEIDITDMQNHVSYEGFEATDQVIRWFWQIVREMPHEELAALLQFITGSPKVPARGFEGLDPQITIKRGSPDRLPSAHTCIHQLVLADYKTRQALAAHLNEIIQYPTGFGFA